MMEKKVHLQNIFMKIPRWQHYCDDYTKGTLNFCSACEYYYETTPRTFLQKLKRFIKSKLKVSS